MKKTQWFKICGIGVFVVLGFGLASLTFKSVSVKNDKKEINHTVNQTFQVLVLFTLPMTIGLSILAKPLWMVFYGPSKFGALVFCYFVFIAFFMSIYTTAVTITQVLKDYKTVFISLLSGVLVKIFLNVRFMVLFQSLGIHAFYGAVTATILGYFLSLIICMFALHKKFEVRYKETFKEFIYIFISAVVMTCVLLLLKLDIPISSQNRIMNVFILMVYTVIGIISYYIMTSKLGILNRVFGEEFVNKILKKFKLKK